MVKNPWHLSLPRLDFPYFYLRLSVFSSCHGLKMWSLPILCSGAGSHVSKLTATLLLLSINHFFTADFLYLDATQVVHFPLIYFWFSPVIFCGSPNISMTTSWFSPPILLFHTGLVCPFKTFFNFCQMDSAAFCNKMTILENCVDQRVQSRSIC